MQRQPFHYERKNDQICIEELNSHLCMKRLGHVGCVLKDTELPKSMVDEIKRVIQTQHETRSFLIILTYLITI